MNKSIKTTKTIIISKKRINNLDKINLKNNRQYFFTRKIAQSTKLCESWFEKKSKDNPVIFLNSGDVLFIKYPLLNTISKHILNKIQENA